MTKNEFLSQLSYKLRVLPESEQRDALEYYEGYISDADNEAAAIESLGSPGEVAATILANYVSAPTRPGKVRLKTVYVAILAIFALPIGLPLAVAAFAIVISLAAVVFSVVITGIALVLAGIVSLVYAPFALMQDFWHGIFAGGIGLAVLGIGILIFKGSAKLFGLFPMVTRAVAKRRSTPNHVPAAYEDSAHFNNPFNGNNSSFNGNMGSTASDELQQANFDANNPWQTGRQQNSNIPPSGEYEPVRRRRSAMGFAVLLIILGVVMFGAAWQAGSRGGQLAWRNGRLNIETFARTQTRGGAGGSTVEAYIDNGPFHEVYIRTNFENIIILPSDTFRIVYSEESDADISIANGVLTVTTVSQNNRQFNVMFGFNHNASREIRAYLPREFFEDSNSHIQARSTSGRIEIDGGFASVNATSTSGRIEVASHANNGGNMYLRSTSGRIKVSGGFSNLEASTTSGRIEVRGSGTGTNRAYLRSTSGRIFAENIQQLDRLEARTTSGRIELGNVSWVTLYARSVSGRIDINNGRVSDIGTRSNTQVSTTSGTVNMWITGQRDDFAYELRSTSGRRQVNGNRMPNITSSQVDSSAHVIDIRTVSGGINLNFAD